MAPHARYAEMDKKQIMQDERLAINAVDAIVIFLWYLRKIIPTRILSFHISNMVKIV